MFELNVRKRRLSNGRNTINIPPQETALLGLYTKAWLEFRPGAGPRGLGKSHTGWIITSDFIQPTYQTGSVFQSYLSLYEVALNNNDPAPLERLFHLSHKDPTALQQFFQRKRTLLNKLLNSSYQGHFQSLSLQASRSKPHRAGLYISRQDVGMQGY